MATKSRLVTHTAYYHTHPDGRMYGYLSELSGCGATGASRNAVIEGIKANLRETMASCAAEGEKVPWHAASPCPDGWNTVAISMRLGPKPAVRWYQYIIPGLLYAGGWLLVRGITALDDLVKWVESKRRK